MIPNGARILPDGTMIFPHRGEAPKFVPGYVKDQGDPFIFRPVMKPCKLREIKIDTANCCGGNGRTDLYCNLLKEVITWRICQACDKNEP